MDGREITILFHAPVKDLLQPMNKCSINDDWRKISVLLVIYIL